MGSNKANLSLGGLLAMRLGLKRWILIPGRQSDVRAGVCLAQNMANIARGVQIPGKSINFGQIIRKC